MEQATKTKPQAGEWENTEAYPTRIKFERDISVVISFASDFEAPKEMPTKDNTPENECNDVFYIFDCVSEGKESSIATSAWTLLKNLKTHMPLAGKTLVITKKNVGGKNNFYVETPKQNEAREDATPKEEEHDFGIDDQGEM